MQIMGRIVQDIGEFSTGDAGFPAPTSKFLQQQPNGSIFGNNFSGKLSTTPVGYAHGNALPIDQGNNNAQFHLL